MLKTLNFRLITTIFVAFTCMYGCEEENISPDSFATLTDFFEAVKSEVQIFEIDDQTTDPIFGKHGTVLYLTTADFEYQDGSAVQGKVTIELTECYSKIQMMFNRLHTVAQDELLISGGSFKLEARQGTDELQLKNRVLAYMPTDNAQDVNTWFNMSLFRGIDTGVANEAIGWDTATFLQGGLSFVDTALEVPVSASVQLLQDFNLSPVYAAFGNLIGWNNCDQFSNVPLSLKTDIEAQTTLEIDPELTITLLLFEDVRTLCYLNHLEDQTFKNSGYQVPKGEKATLVMITLIDEKLHYDVETITIQEVGVHVMDPKPGKLSDLQAVIEKL